MSAKKKNDSKVKSIEDYIAASEKAELDWLLCNNGSICEVKLAPCGGEDFCAETEDPDPRVAFQKALAICGVK